MGSVSTQSGSSPSDFVAKNNYRKIFTALAIGLLILLLSMVYFWKQNSSSVTESQTISTPAPVSGDSLMPANRVAVEPTLSEGKKNNQNDRPGTAEPGSGESPTRLRSFPKKEKTSEREIPKKETGRKMSESSMVESRVGDAKKIPEIKSVTISLNVIPWATISVDGVMLDSLARQKQLTLSPGKHRLVLSHPEFSPKVLEIETRAGEQRSIRYSFYQDAGFIWVEVRPWAAVYIDGRFVDNTPLKRPLPLSPGEHLIELKNPYYETIRKYVEINRGDTLMIREILKK